MLKMRKKNPTYLHFHEVGRRHIILIKKNLLNFILPYEFFGNHFVILTILATKFKLSTSIINNIRLKILGRARESLHKIYKQQTNISSFHQIYDLKDF